MASREHGKRGDRPRARAAAEPGPAAREPLEVAEFLARVRQGSVRGVPPAAAGRAELVDGRVRLAALPAAARVAAILGLAGRLDAVARGRATVALRPALRLGHRDLLRPDLALLSVAPRFGQGVLAAPRDALLVVETIAPPSPRAGRARGPESAAPNAEEVALREVRLPRYAAAAVREVWVLDLASDWAEALRAPEGARYRSRTLWYPGEALAPRAWPGDAVVLLASV